MKDTVAFGYHVPSAVDNNMTDAKSIRWTGVMEPGINATVLSMHLLVSMAVGTTL